MYVFNFKTKHLTALFFLIWLAFPAVLAAQQQAGQPRVGEGHTTISWVLLIVALAIIVVIYKRIKALTRQDSPEEILKRRFARGEITEEEYDEMMEYLKERKKK